MLRNDIVVILLGSMGVAGRLHANIYRTLGIRLFELDTAQPSKAERFLDQMPWGSAVVDVCTPTAEHTKTLAWAFARGARHFIVEKPAALSFSHWQEQVASMPGSQIFSVHHYLFSTAFQIAMNEMPDVTELSTIFNKQRAADDERGRGAGPDGLQPHVLLVEAPHQFAMALSVCPRLRPTSVEVGQYGPRGPDPSAPLAVHVEMKAPGLRRISISTSLRAPLHRSLCLADDSGRFVAIEFPTTSELIARVTLGGASGSTKELFSGEDNALRRTLKLGLESHRSGTVPFESSAEFAGLILARIEDSISLSKRTEHIAS
jgi:predicted dehydrogenase